MRERTRLDQAISATKAIQQEMDDTVELMELAEAEGDNALVDEGVVTLEALADRADDDKIRALLAGEADANDTYLEIHAGAGGTERQDWDEMLQRMYQRWGERRGLEVHTEEGRGVKECGKKG